MIPFLRPRVWLFCSPAHAAGSGLGSTQRGLGSRGHPVKPAPAEDGPVHPADLHVRLPAPPGPALKDSPLSRATARAAQTSRKLPIGADYQRRPIGGPSLCQDAGRWWPTWHSAPPRAPQRPVGPLTETWEQPGTHPSLVRVAAPVGHPGRARRAVAMPTSNDARTPAATAATPAWSPRAADHVAATSPASTVRASARRR